jgi:uncharacterized protein (TIGR02453 family)
MSSFTGFPKGFFSFYKELASNNNRDWFNANKSRFLDDVVDPSLAFISQLESKMKKVSPYFPPIAKRQGGSLMRIYRDTRFSKDKTPYKTNLGIHIRHEIGKDVHAPGFYFHYNPKEIFIGAGVWHPDSSALKKIRFLIDDDPARWKRASRSKKFRDTYEPHGDSLKRPPKGYDADHPMITDLKRKDHVALTSLTKKDLQSAKLPDLVVTKFKIAKPYVRFLCDALHLPS